MNVVYAATTLGVELAANAARTGTAKCLAPIGAQSISGHLHFCDLDNHFIFVDLCTAVVVKTVTGSFLVKNETEWHRPNNALQ